MTNSLTLAKETKASISREKLQEYLKAFGLSSQLTTQEAEQFITLAQEFQLNPFKREIHVVPYGEGSYRKLSIVVGYEVYIKRAERTGQLNGWHAWTEGEADQLKAVVQIYRKDWEHPFTHEVYWTEAVQNRKDGSVTNFWNRMPKFQLRKVAISQGFRLAFPDELGGIPYEGAELSIDVDQVIEHDPIPAQSESTAVSFPIVETPLPATEKVDGFQVLGRVDMELTRAVDVLDDYLEKNASKISPKHVQWIKDQVAFAGTAEKSKAMLRYAQKVVRDGETERPSRRSTQPVSTPSRLPVPLF